MNRLLPWMICLLLALPGLAQDPAELRAAYLTIWDINTEARCDSAIANVLARNINAVFVHIRARGDAYYYPNREDSTYPNSEPRAQLYSVTPSDLDVLQYFIDRLHNAGPRVEVHAWVVVYPAWNRVTPPSSPNHVYNLHPEWITEDSLGNTINYPITSSGDNAPLDPGVPAVQDYLYNVFMDIVRNYDVDGIHFDYIRLLDSDSGYDPVAKAAFLADTGWNYDTDNPSGQLDEVYKAWRRDQISRLVQRVHTQTMLEKPWVEVSPFVIHFSDPVEDQGQGFNWWVAHGAVDVLHLSTYSSTQSGNVSNWNFLVGKLADNGDQNTRPLVAALGDYLLTGPSPDYSDNVVTTLRGNTRPPDGFNFFDYGSLFLDGVPADEHADRLFNAGGPMDGWAPVPSIPHKTDEETTPPNAPASLSVSLVGGVPRITFSRPAAAGDGDLPVHYRLYRDTAASVDLYYDNMVMEWWDLASSRTSFSFDDVAASGGTVYYAAVAYDDWNNEAASTSGPVSVGGGEIIIESHTASGTVTPPSQGFSQSGSWYGSGSTAKSTASGLTGVGSEFSTNATLDAGCTFTPDISVAGNCDIYVTTPSASSVNAANSQFSITHVGGPTTGTFALTSANTGDQWTLLASNIYFNAGTAGSVTFSENAPQGDRFYADAVRFVSAGGGTPVPKEAKPAVSEPASTVTEVIVDSEPTSLDYDDDTGWSSTSYGTNLYNGSSRYYPNAGATLSSVAVWVVDLPRSGRWAIDGWIRTEQVSLAQGAQYRFVDGTGTIRNVTTTHSPGSSGWNINVDGVNDESAYSFNAGRVYITLHGNASGSGMLLADALRFRYLSSSVAGWETY